MKDRFAVPPTLAAFRVLRRLSCRVLLVLSYVTFALLPSSVFAQASKEPVVRAGDVVTVKVKDDPILSGSSVARPDGKLRLKSGTEIGVVGLTIAEVREHVGQDLSRLYRVPNFEVTVQPPSAAVVHITGAVAKAGTYPYVDGMTIVELVKQAGGTRESADMSKMSILRVSSGSGGDPLETISFKLTDVTGTTGIPERLRLRAGDQVVVGETVKK
jgi:protein involved in polysaccharide export with SLBB domain